MNNRKGVKNMENLQGVFVPVEQGGKRKKREQREFVDNRPAEQIERQQIMDTDFWDYKKYSRKDKQKLNKVLEEVNEALSKNGIYHTEIRAVKNFKGGDGEGIEFAAFLVRFQKKAVRIAWNNTIRNCLYDLDNYFERNNNPDARVRLRNTMRQLIG